MSLLADEVRMQIMQELRDSPGAEWPCVSCRFNAPGHGRMSETCEACTWLAHIKRPLCSAITVPPADRLMWVAKKNIHGPFDGRKMGCPAYQSRD